MDAEQTIAEIKRLERIFAEPDARPPSRSDLAPANRSHDDMLAHSPSGSGTGFAAEVKPKAVLGFKASAAFFALEPIATLAFRAGVAPR